MATLFFCQNPACPERDAVVAFLGPMPRPPQCGCGAQRWPVDDPEMLPEAAARAQSAERA